MSNGTKTQFRLVVERRSVRPCEGRGEEFETDPVLEFLARVYEEVNRARDKFPESDGSMTALTEEVGELAKAMLDESSQRVVAEAVQVACMSCRVACEGDPSLDLLRTFRQSGPHPERFR